MNLSPRHRRLFSVLALAVTCAEIAIPLFFDIPPFTTALTGEFHDLSDKPRRAIISSLACMLLAIIFGTLGRPERLAKTCLWVAAIAGLLILILPIIFF